MKRPAPEPPELASWTDDAVRRAQRRGAEGVEAYATWSWGIRYAVERGQVEAGEASATAGIGLRVVRDGKVGFSSTSRLARGALDSAIDRALAATRLLGGEPFDFPRQGPTKRIPGLADRRVLDMTPEDGFAAARDLVRGAREAARGANVPYASFGWGLDAGALANSAGLETSMRSTAVHAHCSVVLEDGEVSTGSESRESRRRDVDAYEVGTEAGLMAERAQGARTLPKGKPPVVLLRPDAAAPLLELLLVIPLLGERLARGESPYAGKMGQRIATDRLTVVDDPLQPHGLGSAPRDEEGVASRRIPLVSKGVMRGSLFDLATAAQYEGRSTASGVRGESWGAGSGYQNAPSPGARNVRFDVRGAKPLAKLLGEVKRGVLVNEVLGVHTANAVTGDFGLTSSSLLYVENGEVAYPLKPCSLSGSMPKALFALVGASREEKSHSGDHGGAFTTPTVAFRGIRVVG